MRLQQSTDNPIEPAQPVNAVNDTASTLQDSTVSIPVLVNDSSGAANTELSVENTSNPVNGWVSVVGQNILYSPHTGFYGTDEFTYTVMDSNGTQDTATVTVNVIQDNAGGPGEPGWTELKPDTSFYWQLQGTISTSYNVDVYGIDLEDNEYSGLIQQLQADGKKVVCYISAGSYEEWRSDKDEFDASDLGNPLGDWPGEYYLDIRSENVRRIMRSRIDRAVNAGCDALEPDNTDAYQASNGLGITAQDQLDYLHFLAAYAHSTGMSIGLKNTVDLISSGNLADVFDWTLNESCYVYNECDTLLPFLAADKAVYIAMYTSQSKSSRCADASSKGFHLAFYGSDYALDGSSFSTCP